MTAVPVSSTVTFCAGDGRGRSGHCVGDAAGAFVREEQRADKKRWAWDATGLISWGEGCAQKNKNDYYTRVYPFIDLTGKKMEENSANENDKK